jgi:D-alanyl-D-alanine endopeptidase (penicillin-binding protein 7)
LRNLLNQHFTFGVKPRHWLAALALCVGLADVQAVEAATPAKAKVVAETRSSSMVGKPGLQSRAALIMDADTGEVLYGKNMSESVPIASITKLMTAIIVLDAKQNMDEVLTVTDADIDRLKNSHSRLRVGTKLPRKDMLVLALMSSENRAASALARNYPGGLKAAIRAMNQKAASLGMRHSRFADGTGLNANNRASLLDLAKLVKAAGSYPQIHQASTTSSRMVRVAGLKQPIKYNNTNPLVNNKGWNIGVTKTGYIREAGMCLVMQARIASTNTVLVLMDSWGKRTRVGDAARVKQWMESSVRLAANNARRMASNQRM